MKKIKVALLTSLLITASENQVPVLNMWQSIDSKGNIFPWFTNSFLKELAKWDISNWDIFEWGSGYSTLWFSQNCKNLTTIEHSLEWGKAVQASLDKLNIKNVSLKIRKGSKQEDIGDNGLETSYVEAIEEENKKYDCIIIDGIHRNDCAFKAIKHIKPGGIIILDNADQKTIGLNSTPTFELLKQYELKSYPQKNHADWKTVYWIIK